MVQRRNSSLSTTSASSSSRKAPSGTTSPRLRGKENLDVNKVAPTTPGGRNSVQVNLDGTPKTPRTKVIETDSNRTESTSPVGSSSSSDEDSSINSQEGRMTPASPATPSPVLSRRNSVNSTASSVESSSPLPRQYRTEQSISEHDEEIPGEAKLGGIKDPAELKFFRRNSLRPVKPYERPPSPTPSTASQMPPRVVGHESSCPMTLLALLRRQQEYGGAASSSKSSKSRRKQQQQHLRLLSMEPKKSCLKKDSVCKLPKKCVKFATNAFTDRVWGLVKTTTNKDEINFDRYWWSDDEMDEIKSQIIKVIVRVEDAYGDVIRDAYKSTIKPPASPRITRRLSNTGRNKNNNCSDVELDFNAVLKYSMARGLESVVAQDIIVDFKDKHRDAVLRTQEQLLETKLRNGGSSQNSESSKFSLDDEELNLIREKSLYFSNPSRLVATKMAEFDFHVVKNHPRPQKGGKKSKARAKSK